MVIKREIQRAKDLLSLYVEAKIKELQHTSHSQLAANKRNVAMLRAKVNAQVEKIGQFANPKLFIVYFTTVEGDIYKQIFQFGGEDLRLYFELLNLIIPGPNFKILYVEPVTTTQTKITNEEEKEVIRSKANQPRKGGNS